MSISHNIFLIFVVLLLSSCNNKSNLCPNGMSKNKKIFQCYNKKTKDFSFLSKYKQLEAIDLTGSGVKNINFVKNLENLKILILINTNVEDISALKNNKKLEELYLSNTLVKELSPLSKLTNLKILHIENTDIKINILKTLNLKQLSLENLFADEYDNTYYQYSNISDIINYYQICNPLREFKEKVIYKDNCNKVCRNPEYLTINKNNLIGYKDFLISLYYKYINTNIRYLNLWGLTYNYERTLEFENISALILFKNSLKKLKIHLKTDKYISVLSKLSELNELHLSGNIKKIDKLPSKLKTLYLYNTNLNNFSFIDNSGLKKLVIITLNENKYQYLKKKYPHIKINILNTLYFSPLAEFPVDPLPKGKDICEIKVKGYRDNFYENFDLTKINERIQKFSFKGAYIVYPEKYEYNIVKKLQKRIIPINFYYMKYALNKLNYDINKLDDNMETILDKVILLHKQIVNTDKEIENLKNKFIGKRIRAVETRIERLKQQKIYYSTVKMEIEYLRKHGAKRSCEILKTKCKPLSPEIEKILNGDK